ncbi:hypothetical protein [Streptomyces sp. 2314.4]|uniref:hypothetical protein n=1 Tax=Streptomyces sp. 2314.4 TaxID=1881025 RepID=UPI000B895814|nr:hypothetical protein [Streptomyces sp. 2314.4]
MSRFVSFLHEVYGRDVEIYRKPNSAEVVADCRQKCARQILLTCGFEKSPAPFRLRLPQDLSEAEKKARSTRAAVHLFHAGHYADIASDLRCESALDAAWAEIRKNRSDLTGAAGPAAGTHMPASRQTAASRQP